MLTLPRRPGARTWAVRVVPNLYPAVSPGTRAPLGGDGFFRGRTATGRHELVVETPRHDQELADRPPGPILLLLDALQQRLRALEALPGTRYVIIFKNEGAGAGTSLEHPHSQVVALDFVPPDVRRRVQVARRYHRQYAACLLCAVVAEERRTGARTVFDTDGFIAFAPYASGSAGETMLVPAAHDPSFSAAEPAVREGLGRGLVKLLRRTREAFDSPGFNLVLHSAPRGCCDDPALHWYWQLSPHLTRTAGFELGTGVRINPMAPEEAARLLGGSD